MGVEVTIEYRLQDDVS